MMTNPWTNNDAAFGPMFCDSVTFTTSSQRPQQDEPTKNELTLDNGTKLEVPTGVLSSTISFMNWFWNKGISASAIVGVSLSDPTIGNIFANGYTSLKNVEVASNVTSIGEHCFGGEAGATPAPLENIYFYNRDIEQISAMSSYPFGIDNTRLSAIQPDIVHPTLSASVFPIEDVDPFADGDNITDIKATTVLVKKADWTRLVGSAKPVVGEKFTTTDGDNYKVYSIVPEQSWWKLVGRSY